MLVVENFQEASEKLGIGGEVRVEFKRADAPR
jgi:hypothetical protein